MVDLSTMALPFGVAPRRSRLARTGFWRGRSYAFAITLLVGANPSWSTFDTAFHQIAERSHLEQLRRERIALNAKP
jgi:hypothetical protein